SGEIREASLRGAKELSQDGSHARERIERTLEGIIGKVIGDKYQVTGLLGQGGMGTVLIARHKDLNKLVAIKLLNPSVLVDETAELRFKQEAQAGSRLQHPNLVAVFDYGFTEAQEPFLVMEYVQGNSLEGLLEEQQKLNAVEFTQIFVQVCKAL